MRWRRKKQPRLDTCGELREFTVKGITGYHMVCAAVKHHVENQDYFLYNAEAENKMLRSETTAAINGRMEAEASLSVEREKVRILSEKLAEIGLES